MRFSMRLGLLGFCILVSAVACCPAEPPDDPLGYQVELDVTYDEKNQLKADLYLPSDAESPCPVVVIVHGGAWMSGDKWMPATYARLFAKHQIAAISINYRLAPKHKFPCQVDDLRRALAWTQSHAEQYDWDLSRVGLFGYSAGAHLCCMMGTLVDEDFDKVQHTTNMNADELNRLELPTISVIVAGGTPVDFRKLPPENTTLSYFLGGTRSMLPNVYEYASPAAMVSPGDVPTLFFHGESDLLVPILGAQMLYQRHRQLGISSQFVRIDSHGHLLSFMHERSRAESLKFLQQRLLSE